MDKKPTSELAALMNSGPESGSEWRHRKGGLYTIVGTAIDEATLKPFVIYTREGIWWKRPLEEFMDGRFTPVRDTRGL